MLESLHVLDLYFPSELSILKLPFFMKHPVYRTNCELTSLCRSSARTHSQMLYI